MSILDQVVQRSENKCELCQSPEALTMYEVRPQLTNSTDNCFMICGICKDQLEKRTETDPKHWRCLTSSMWSEVPGVQVVSWRMLNRLNNESWAIDNLDMLYLEEDMLIWAKAGAENETEETIEFHKDANGNVLEAGDSVVLTKSLDVKGSSLTAKLGTVVKNIRLVEDNTDQIEGKVEGQTIVILTKYVRKQSN
ncbi:PhnA domain-containing protein [Pedobacter sp. MC2016-14]|uniref:PhnA domain-containing protein n=1 Tax=Pedobacter sp. MC2016-14 TaxID=2897327 RepID=UPI001E5C1E0C|nr:alkylphosphonate utilization protein [Pedobacter sp. MC2016-14]MCD0489886.1 PhnA domain-containing protein [Pedobacter sp. MC2016-14]